MEVDQPPTRLSDSSEILQSSAETRQYLDLVMEHAAAGACVRLDCPECGLLTTICQLIQSEVFTVKEYPVSICERKEIVAEMAVSEATAAATQRFSKMP